MLFILLETPNGGMIVYKLLVVDDETIIADGMASLLANNEELNIEVHKCYSAIEALKLMEDIKFDIILTDIVMPQMNGLEFLKIIKEKWPLCYVVFLTGYDDFRYVYEAIQYPYVKYLLKAEGSNKIIEVIKELMDSDEIKTMDEKADLSLNRQNQQLQKDIMASILLGETHEIDSDLFQLNRIKLDYNKSLHLGLIKIGASEDILSVNEKIRIYNKLSREIENSIYKIANVYLLSFDYINITGFFQLKDKHELEEIREKLWSIYNNYSNYRVMCILDSDKIVWQQCSVRYLFLKRLMNEKSLHSGGVLLTEDIIERDLMQDSQNLIREKIRQNSQLSAYLERGDEESFFCLFEQMTSNLTADESMHKNCLLERYYDIATIFLACINKNNLKEQLSCKVDLCKLMRVDYHTDWEKAVYYLRNLGREIFCILNHESNEPYNKILRDIERYIDDNIHEGLTLYSVADAVGMNPSYLSRFYKKMTGKKFSDYLSQKKIEEAKRLLRNSNMSIQEIASTLGYSSSSNFIRFFKKEISLTPQEYRELCKE